MQLILPWGPSMNHYWQSRIVAPRGGKAFVSTYISSAGQTYRSNVQAAVIATLHRMPEPLEGRLAVAITLHQPDRRARDLDNVLKPLLDALTHARVWRDDSQIDDLRVRRGPKSDKPCAVVTIITIKEADARLFP